jgi:hypothetical protein
MPTCEHPELRRYALLAVVGLILASHRFASAQGSSIGAGADPATAPIVIDIPLEARSPHVRAAAEKGEVALGAPFTLFITVSAQSGVTVNLREPIRLGPAFEVRRKVSSVRQNSDGSRIVEWQVEVLAWEVGELRLPAIAVTFVADGRAGQVETAATPIRVVGALAEDDDGTRLRGLASPVELTRTDSPWWLAIPAAAVVLTFLAGPRLLRRYRGGIGSAPTGFALLRHQRSPGQHALYRLEAIENTGILIAQPKLGYTEMADVIREFVSAHTGSPNLELTNSELQRALEVHPRTAHARSETAAWFSEIDHAMYAAESFSGTDATAAALRRARALVMRIVEVDVAATADAAEVAAVQARAP